MEIPQTEKGYTIIANEIIDNLQTLYLSPNEWKILWTVIRKTYGWKKKEDRISISQFQTATKLSRPNTYRAIKSLVAKSILVAKPSTVGTIYMFNKLYTEWKQEPSSKYRGVVAKLIQTSSQIDTQVVAKSIHPHAQQVVAKLSTTKTIKTTITKETITKEIGTFLQMFSNVNPSYKNLFKNKTERACASRLLEQYGIDKLTNLMNQLPAIIQKPYSPSITTPYQLEVKMGTLIAFMQKDKKQVNKFSVTKI